MYTEAQDTKSVCQGAEKPWVSALPSPPLPDTIWKLAVAEILKNHETKLSPDTLQMRWLGGDTVQVLWLCLLLNSSSNCSIFSPTLVQFVPCCFVWSLPGWGSFQTAAVMPPTSHQHPNNVKPTQVNRLCDSTPPTHMQRNAGDADFSWGVPLREQQTHTREAKPCLAWFWGNNHFIYKVFPPTIALLRSHNSD